MGMLNTGVQALIRKAHLIVLARGLPERVALCMHSLERRHHARFEECVRFFADHGYAFTDPDGLLAAADAGKRVLVSFDDNYKAWYDSLALFDRLGMRATFYVNTEPFRDRADARTIANFYERIRFLGERVPLTTAELKSIAAAGHTIGSHTHAHYTLTQMTLEQATQEVRRGKEELEQVLKTSIRHFAFPFGMRRCFNRELRDICVGRLGFATVANAIPGLQHRPQAAVDLNRSIWNFERPLDYNISSLMVDGALFERLTGRSAVG
jgi:peptidoglycan/xylan/chitin deacetylase (PgdA/CDA1 family)